MRVIPPFDLFFVVFYSLLILLVGAAAYSITGRTEVPLLALLLLAVYLALALRRPLRRRRAAEAALPAPWLDFLLDRSAYYRGLDEGGRSRFERDVRLFFAEVRVAGTGGRPASWQSRLLIAAAAAAMLHGRPGWEPPLHDGVTVYPGFAFDRNYQAGRGNIAGQAPADGPLLIAEKSLIEGFADGQDGFNVAVHELAHYFDLEARRGGLEVEPAPGRRLLWAEAIDREYGGHDFASTALPAYAAQNEAEFFACASEAFFEDPRALRRAHPGLFSLLQGFYGQDPTPVLGEPPRAAN